MLNNLNDEQNVDIAWKEYREYHIGEQIEIGKGKTSIGYVSDILGKRKGFQISKENEQRALENFRLNGYVVTDKKMGGAIL